jgi:putative ABC transport system permease protein
MLSLYSTLSLRYLRRRWFRATLIVGSIALGVMTLVATRALNETMTRAGLASLNPLAGTADLIVGNGEAPVERSLAADLVKVPGVEAVSPRIFHSTHVAGLQDAQVLLVGIDPEAEQQTLTKKQDDGSDVLEVTPSPYFLKQLKAWQKSVPWLAKLVSPDKLLQGGKAVWKLVPVRSVLVGKELEKELENKLPEGATLQVDVPGKKERVPVWRVGVVTGHGPLAALGGNVLLCPNLDTAAELAGLKKGQVSRIDLTLSPGADRERVKEAVARRLAGRATVQTPEERSLMVANAMVGMQTGFSLSGWAALVVALFLVYNALSVTVAERRHEIGILLSVGATRAQIWTLFAGEAALLGLAGSLLGIPMGLGLARVLQPLVEAVLQDVFMTISARSLEVSAWVLAAAVVIGVLTAVAACVFPAMTAASEKPAEAVRRIPPAHTWRYWVAQAAASAFMIVLGVLCIVVRGLLRERMGPDAHRFAMYGGLLMVLLGALLATPLLAAVAARALQPVARRLFGIESRLAADNLVRAPRRTGLVIAALAAGVALVMQTAGTIRSNRQALRDWTRDFIGADLIVWSGSPGGTGGQGRPMARELGRQIERKVSGVAKALPLRSLKVNYGDTQVMVEAVDAPAYVKVNARRRTAALHLYEALARTPDGAIVSENFAALFQVRRGGTVTLTSPSGPVTLRVLGRVVDYSWNRGTVIVNRKDFLDHWRDDKVDTFDVYLKPGANDTAVREDIQRHFGAANGLMVWRRQQLQDYFDRVIDQLYGIAYALQVVVMVVAALGVVMAFLISVLQRRREMGLLRAIGASRVQVVYSVLAEAALIGVIGTAIGLAVGVPLEWFVLRVAFLEESGYLFAVHIPWVESLVIAAAALLLATLAGLGPAVYAVWQRIPEAIAYE